MSITSKSMASHLQVFLTDVMELNSSLLFHILYNITKSAEINYHSVQNLLSSWLLSKNIKFRIYRIVILPVVLYGCETWSLTLRVEHRLRVFENRVLRRIFGPKGDEVTGGWI
jgi:hypothetical protein